MSTVFDIRKLRLPRISRAALITGVLATALAVTVGVVGTQLYKKLTTTTAVAYFPQALALFPGDKVQIMGIRVGTVDRVEPAADKTKVAFHYASRYKVPANATASILNPSLVASRVIQLSPPYITGPALADGAVIPSERTQVPVEWDDLRDSIGHILQGLGPTPQQPKGPIGNVIESAADGFANKGQKINETLNALSDALSTLNDGRGDFVAVVRGLAQFVNALYQHDQQFSALNTDLASFTGKFTNTNRELADALRDTNTLLASVRKFVDQNGAVTAHDIDDLAQVTNAILQPASRDGLETALHVFPHFATAITNFYSPATGTINGIAAIPNFANPMQLVCSAIQAGSRLGYQDSAEMCAQYLAPVLDAMKFNYLPFGLNMLNTASALPKQIAYSEPRLRPPPGYKDTTVPGIWSRDTPFSRGNHEPGWIVAPGMQGLRVSPPTQSLLTAASLAELMGGPDITAPPAPAHLGSDPLPGPPNAYDETNPLPPPWYPQPGPPPPGPDGTTSGPTAPGSAPATASAGFPTQAGG